MESKDYLMLSYAVILTGVLMLIIHFGVGLPLPIYVTIPFIFLFEIASIIVTINLFQWSKLQKYRYYALKRDNENKRKAKEIIANLRRMEGNKNVCINNKN